jgi:hypothetical protein
MALTYGAVVKLRTEGVERLGDIGLTLKRQMREAQRSVAESGRQMVENASKSFQALPTNIEAGGLTKALQDQFSTIEKHLRRLQTFPELTTAKSLYTDLVRVEHLLEQVQKRIRALSVTKASEMFNKPISELTQTEVAAGEAKVPKELIEFRDSLKELMDWIEESVTPLRDLELAQKDNTLAAAEASQAFRKESNALKDAERASRGTWLVMTQWGGMLQGVNLALAASTMNVQGLAMSMMFASTNTFMLMMATAALVTPLMVLARVAMAAVQAIISLAQTIATTLVGAVTAAAATITGLFIKTIIDAKERVADLHDQFQLLAQSQTVGDSLYAGAIQSATRYRRSVEDVSGAMIALGKAGLLTERNLDAVHALAARNNKTMDEAAQAYIDAVGYQRENVNSLQEWGVVVEGVTEDTDRAAVAAMVQAQTLQQVGAATEVYAQTTEAATQRAKNAWTNLTDLFSRQAWRELFTPLTDNIGETLENLAPTIQRSLSKIDLGNLSKSLTKSLTALTPLITSLAGDIGNALTTGTAILTVAVEDLAVKLGEIDWGTVYEKANIALGKIAAWVVGIGSAFYIMSKSVIENWNESTNAINALTTESDKTFAEMAADAAMSAVLTGTEWKETIGGVIQIFLGLLQVVFGVFDGITTYAATSAGIVIDELLSVLSTIAKVASEIAGFLASVSETTDKLNINPFGESGTQKLRDLAQNLAGVADWAEEAREPFLRGEEAFEAIKNAFKGVTDGFNTYQEGVDRIANAPFAGADLGIEAWVATYEAVTSATESVEEYLAKVTDPYDSLVKAILDGENDINLAGEEIGKTFDYVADKGSGSADRVKEEIQSLVSKWQGLVQDALKPTMDFDYTSWIDQMTTAYDSMGRDFGAETGFGHVDTWDENMRRIMDIVNRGMDSPWTRMFVPPDDVIAKGNEAVQAWAASMARNFQLGRMPELINWEGFITNLQEQIEQKANWESIAQIAQQKASEAGLDVTNSMVQAALGIQLSPEAAKALQLGQTIATAFDAQMKDVPFAESTLSAMTTSFETNQIVFQKQAGTVADTWIDAYIGKMAERGGEIVESLAPFIESKVLAFLANWSGGSGGHGD